MATTMPFKEDYATLTYDDESQIIYLKLYNECDSAGLRAVLDYGIKLFKETGAHKWLSDNRDMDAVSDEDTNWINNDWLPRAVEAGWQYWALVVPADIEARTNLNEFVTEFYDKGVRVMVFSKVDEADAWLKRF
jgi:hypothetical protein